MEENDKYSLKRFIFRQNRVYERVVGELKNGKKVNCWMWYIFPQLRHLGKSRKSFVFGIANLEEAKAYLNHPVLGPHLIQCCEILLEHKEKTAVSILGDIDAEKLRSSMTLFEAASEENLIFGKVLEIFYRGERDRLTLEILEEISKGIKKPLNILK